MFRSPRMMHIFLSSFIFCSVVSTWLVKWFRHSMVPPGCLYITPITNFLLGCVFRHVSNQMFSISNSCPLICLLSIAKSSLASILMLLLYMSPTPPLALLGFLYWKLYPYFSIMASLFSIFLCQFQRVLWSPYFPVRQGQRPVRPSVCQDCVYLGAVFWFVS